MFYNLQSHILQLVTCTLLHFPRFFLFLSVASVENKIRKRSTTCLVKIAFDPYERLNEEFALRRARERVDLLRCCCCVSWISISEATPLEFASLEILGQVGIHSGTFLNLQKRGKRCFLYLVFIRFHCNAGVARATGISIFDIMETLEPLGWIKKEDSQ